MANYEHNIIQDWTYIRDNFNIIPDVSYISCDTRDFAAIFTSTDIKLFPFNEALSYIKEHPELFNNSQTISVSLIKENDILPLLLTLEEKTGGKRKWRLINYEYSRMGWLKYIRFVRYNEHEFICYTTCGDDVYPINVEYLKKLNITYS